MEIERVILELKVKSTPSDEYTAMGYKIGEIVCCTLEQYKDDENTLTLNIGLGDGVTFRKDELQITKAIVTYTRIIDDVNEIEDNFLR